MKKKALIIAITLLIIFSFIAHRQRGSLFKVSENYQPEERNLTVAACPTFYYLLDKLSEREGVDVLRTNQTRESIYLLQSKSADIAIGGRMLMPDEPKLFFEVIGPGYSFISDEEIVLLENEMGYYDFFTDLSISEIIEEFSHISQNNIKKVLDVYDYLDKGIVITSVENTDYSQSRIVHIFMSNGFRHRFSRAPIVYYSSQLNEEEKALAREAIDYISEKN